MNTLTWEMGEKAGNDVEK